MLPWIWIWSPQLYFPFSGSVTQDIEPETRLFDSISASAGIGDVERRAFQVASYGRQLGLITEVLLDLADKQPSLSADAQAATVRLHDIRDRIEQIKAEELQSVAERLSEQIVSLRQQDPDGFEHFRQRLLPLLQGGGA